MDEVGTVVPELENLEVQETIQKKVLSLRFEKQSYQLVVGTDQGYRLVNYFDPYRPTVKRGLLNKSIQLIELIPKTKILVYVATDEPKKVNFYEYPSSKIYTDPISYAQPVVALRTSISRIAIALENGVHLYSSKIEKFMSKLHYIIFNTPNPTGLVDLSEHDFNTYLAYPSNNKKGEVEIFDCLSLKSKVTFEAHVTPIVAISFSPTGRSIATASEKGTIIRVHIVFTGECVYEFRRSLQVATIHSLGFGIDSTFLGVTSNSTTVHVFKLATRQSSGSGPSVLMGAIQRAAEAYLPTEINKLLNQERAFAFAVLPVPNMDTISLVHKFNDNHYLVVATFDGYVYTYTLDEVNGGQCSLLKSIGIDKDHAADFNEEWVLVGKPEQRDPSL